MQKKVFRTTLFVIMVMAISMIASPLLAQWPEYVDVGSWGGVKVYRGTPAEPRAFPFRVSKDSLYEASGCWVGDYVYEYELIGNLSKLTREMFSYPYLPDLGLNIIIRAVSAGNGVEDWCKGDDKFSWGAGFCDRDVLTLKPQPDTNRIWFCSPHGDTGPVDVAVGTNVLNPGNNVILGPGFDQSYLPVTTEQFTKVSNVCLKTIQNVNTKCIEEAYLAPLPESGECADVPEWESFTDVGYTNAIYTGTPTASEACDQTLEIPPQEDLDRILATYFPTYTIHISHTDALIDKSVSDTQTGCICPPCIRYSIRGYLKCACPP